MIAIGTLQTAAKVPVPERDTMAVFSNALYRLCGISWVIRIRNVCSNQN